MLIFRRYLFPLAIVAGVLSVPLQIVRTSAQHPVSKQDSVCVYPYYRLINPTFLGNEKRNYYGNKAPDNLSLQWKLYLGAGETVISRKLGSRIWEGAGWTGQPLLVEEDTTLYLIQGAYDHNLKKIDARTGKIIWEYTFDDVIKGTGTLWYNPADTEKEDRLVILQGSRLGIGNYLDSKHIPSYRGISFITGREMWRLDVKWTDSYSRDVDGSALMIGDTAYIGLENSLFTLLNPDHHHADTLDGMLQPHIFREVPLYKKSDVVLHNKNIVTESSPCLLNGMIYISSGSGHVFGYDLKKQALTWDFYIGSDMDGSAVVTGDSCLLVTIEKQYIKGKGGVFKLNPALPPNKAVVWYMPTESYPFGSWEGGIIGSAAVNDAYNDGSLPCLAAVIAIDGFLYVVEHKAVVPGVRVKGPDGINRFATPKLCFKEKIGPSISTPLMTENRIVAAGYNGLKLYAYDRDLHFTRIDSFHGSYEATPVVHDGKIFIGCRDGYFYCLGN
jgi:outer membrane protein assembly factor BamB